MADAAHLFAREVAVRIVVGACPPDVGAREIAQRWWPLADYPPALAAFDGLAVEYGMDLERRAELGEAIRDEARALLAHGDPDHPRAP